MQPTVTCLNHLPTQHEEAYLCVIEACQGSRNKFKYAADFATFLLHAVLPAGTSFPYDFGFVPSTLGEDGDPLDVLVLMDEAAPVGCVVACRLVGVIEAEQCSAGRATIRNDRLLGVAVHARQYRRCVDIADIASEELDEMERFFVFYNAQKGVDFRPLRREGSARAKSLVEVGARRFESARETDGGDSRR